MKTLIINTIISSLAAVIIGGLIGSERARHGRAAGMRTHILVCLGSCMTAMTSMYVSQTLGVGDVLRLPAQVISGIGFLGAGMIILKPNNVITGLTTAAGGLDHRDNRYSGGLRLLYRCFNSDGAFSCDDYSLCKI